LFFRLCVPKIQAKVAFKIMKGMDTLMRCTILVKRNLQFLFGNQAFFAPNFHQSAHKRVLFC